jgi:Methyltransferase FkbM domain
MLRETVQNYLLTKGMYTSRTTDDLPIRRLIQSLKPMQTDKPLIRIGLAGDGGYLVPGDLGGIVACFSPGVANVATFEADLANRGIECFLADHSVNAAPIESMRFHFYKKFLGSTDDDVYMRLPTWISKTAAHIPEGDLILQMDIEGSEYDVLLDTPDELLKRFRILVIEFHGLHASFERLGFILINFVFQKLLRYFTVVHIHPNNGWPIRTRNGIEIPPVMEFTFLRKDRSVILSPAIQFPHPLDCINVPTLPELSLPSSWYT